MSGGMLWPPGVVLGPWLPISGQVDWRFIEGLLGPSFFKSRTSCEGSLSAAVSGWGLEHRLGAGVSCMFSDKCVLLPLHAPTATKPTSAPWVVLGLAGARCFPFPPSPASLKAHCVSIPCACGSMHALATP